MLDKFGQPKTSREWQAVIGIDNQCFNRLVQMCSSFLVESKGLTYEQSLAMNPNKENFRFKKLEDLIFATLLVLKSGITFDLFGYLFEIDQSNALKKFRSGISIIHDALELEGYTPIRDFTDIEYFHNQFKKGEVLILDGTEQRIQRPLDYDTQKEFYSGKKKSHTAKTLILSTMDRYIHYVSYLYIGKSHDFSILKEEFPPGEKWFDPFTVRLDLGYIGFEKAYPNVVAYLPKKKPKGGEL